jgi:peptidyl-prolyl cis-trans isomerase C
MKRTVCLALFTAVLSFAQATAPPQSPPPAKPAAPVNLMTLPADIVIATIDGDKILAGELQAALRAFDPPQQQVRLADLRPFLETFVFMKKLAGMAEKAGLDRKTPLKEQIAYNRLAAVASAQLAAMQDSVFIAPEEVRKFYDANPDLYTEARIKLIYIPFSPNASAQQDPAAKKVLTESEAKAKAEKLYADLQGGADFVKLVKENSGDPTSAAKDGDYTPIRKSDQIPPEIKNAVFALKPNEVARPIRQPNGFYLIRLEGIDKQSFASVERKLTSELADAQVRAQVESTQKSIQIKIEYPAVFAAVPAPAPPPPAPAK